MSEPQSWSLRDRMADLDSAERGGVDLLVIGGGMQLMGLAMIRWIVNIKV